MEISTLTDGYLICVQCGRKWLFTAGNRRFFTDKGLQIPKRCPDCRAKRKASIDPGQPEVVRDDRN